MPSTAEIEALGKRKNRRWPGWLAAIVVIAAAGGGWWYWQAQSGGQVATYETTPAAVKDITVKVTATGTIEPIRQVDISSELSGTVRSVESDFNDVVKKGQVLATLDTDKLEANVESARAQVSARQAALEEAKVTVDERREAYERAVRLNERGIASSENLLTAKAAWQRADAAIKTAEANIRVAQADLKLQETNLAKACICAPIDGIVLKRSVEPGQIVAATLQAPVLFTLAENLTAMELTVAIDEADIGQVVIGNDATFTVEAYQDRTFKAAITGLRFAPETVEGVVTYQAILDVDNSDLLLRPGMTATAEITVDEKAGVLTVPNTALRFSPPVRTERSGGSGLLGMILPRRSHDGNRRPAVALDADGMRPLWVLKDGQPQEVAVRTGATDGIVTEIVAGDLKPGDPVITDVRTAR
ncbi:efflux transporter periplasmic adaptor subunit [Zhengella mangrovi]|uniref:Efflux transporter periplasmic adaptor subunit n=1 Tax=Zhengella mangrovi TaxID=1982044 RepID=A0A2G1QU17_9HYPH|nr:efflux RND transporter periplasmic adaptor subunit [Zhengella mangrovi]PHP69023.1 efflux transporter periplasmic adaptor subunit [Zhengella mangrovi]